MPSNIIVENACESKSLASKRDKNKTMLLYFSIYTESIGLYLCNLYS